VRVEALTAQAAALLHAEAVLLVNDSQGQIAESDAALNERVRANDHLHGSFGQARIDFVALGRGRAAGQQATLHVFPAGQGVQQAGDMAGVLLGQDARGGHERGLLAVLHGNSQGEGGYGGLARPHITLQEAIHGHVARQVAADVVQCALLRRRQLEGERSKRRLQPVVRHNERLAGD